MIGVTNIGKETVVARYDGQDFEFKPDVAVALSDEAATHIFGYGLDDKTRALIRLGWLANSTALSEALKRLDDFVFSEAKVVFDEPLPIKGTPTAPSPAGNAPMKIPVLTAKKS